MRRFKKCAVLTMAAIMAFSLVGCGSSTEDSKVKQVNNGAEDKQEETVKTEFGVGETAEYEDIQVSLVKVIQSKGDDMFIKPDDGNVFEICVFEIENNSSEDITISSLTCFEAYCDDTSLNQDIMGLQTPEAEKYGQLDGDIAAGKKMKGAIVYQVPKKWKELEVNVTPGFWSEENIKFVAKNK